MEAWPPQRRRPASAHLPPMRTGRAAAQASWHRGHHRHRRSCGPSPCCQRRVSRGKRPTPAVAPAMAEGSRVARAMVLTPLNERNARRNLLARLLCGCARAWHPSLQLTCTAAAMERVAVVGRKRSAMRFFRCPSWLAERTYAGCGSDPEARRARARSGRQAGPRFHLESRVAATSTASAAMALCGYILCGGFKSSGRNLTRNKGSPR